MKDLNIQISKAGAMLVVMLVALLCVQQVAQHFVMGVNHEQMESSELSLDDQQTENDQQNHSLASDSNLINTSGFSSLVHTFYEIKNIEQNDQIAPPMTRAADLLVSSLRVVLLQQIISPNAP